MKNGCKNKSVAFIILVSVYIHVYPIQTQNKKIKDKKKKNTNYTNASHKYCTCAERNIVSQAAGWGTVQDDL